MKTPKQSRKISILAAILVLLVGIFIGGYLVLKSGRGAASQLDDILKGTPAENGACQADASNKDKDSDNDGLKDWQEMQVYFTDPCNSDTDGDGYLDGEEVASGYDPLKKAPGDELPGTTPKGPRPLPANLTRALSSMLSQQIATGKIESFSATGKILSSTKLEKYPALQQSIQSIVGDSDQLFAPDPIDDSQIKITPDNSKEAIQRYAASAAEYLAQQENAPQSDEAEIFLQAMQSNDFSELQKNLTAYRESYAKFKTMTVPTELVPIHKEQLAIYSSVIKIYEAIKDINSDPLKASLALQKYQVALLQFTNWIQKLASFIEAHP